MNNSQKQTFTYYPSGNIRYEEYYNIYGEPHRIGGPAYIEYYESGEIKSEAYYVNAKFHRLDGPALCVYFYSGEIKSEAYYVNGNEIDIEKFCEDYGCTLPFNEEDQLIFNLTHA